MFLMKVENILIILISGAKTELDLKALLVVRFCRISVIFILKSLINSIFNAHSN